MDLGLKEVDRAIPANLPLFFAPKRLPDGVAKMGSAGMLRSHPKPVGHRVQPLAWRTPSYVTTFSFEPTNSEKQHFYLLASRWHHHQDTFSELLFHKDPLRQAAGIFAHPIVSHQHCRFGDTRVFCEFFSSLSHRN